MYTVSVSTYNDSIKLITNVKDIPTFENGFILVKGEYGLHYFQGKDVKHIVCVKN